MIRTVFGHTIVVLVDRIIIMRVIAMTEIKMIGNTDVIMKIMMLTTMEIPSIRHEVIVLYIRIVIAIDVRMMRDIGVTEKMMITTVDIVVVVDHTTIVENTEIVTTTTTPLRRIGVTGRV